MGGGAAPTPSTKTVVVLGAAYGGAHAAQVLASGLPEDWKVLLIDRNTHANHVYVMPRYAVLPGHEYKAFIPFNKVFLEDPPKKNHIYLNATITSLRPNHITLSKAFPELGFSDRTIPFDYAVYSLGSHLPPSLDLWKEEKADGAVVYHGLKAEGCAWLQRRQKIVEESPTVLVVGGGALGIQFATDIKSVYPDKEVTLLHSRLRLLPRFHDKMHDEILSTCQSLGIELILGERLDLDSVEEGSAKVNARGQKVVRTVTGREIAADLLLLCTGQVPNTQLLKAMDAKVVNESNNQARVLRTLQLASSSSSLESKVADALKELKVNEDASTDAPQPTEDEEKTPYPQIFAIGDAADAFGAIAAGHNAYSQAELAAKNIIKLILRDSKPKADLEPLDRYTPSPPAIKVSLGLKKAVYQLGDAIGVKTDGQDDLQAAAVWPFFGIKVEKDEDMKA